jgi:hypothetical protein
VIFTIPGFEVPEDVLRIWVLLMGVFVMYLSLYAAWKSWRTLRDQPDLKFLMWGRTTREIAVVILLFEELWSLAYRLGNENFTWQTPVLQVAIILLIVAWNMVDRRIYRTVNMDRFISQIQEGMTEKQQHDYDEERHA